MMLGLPSSTSVRQNIPKQWIINKGNLTSSDRKLFDSDIHSITIIGEISKNTMNVNPGNDIKRIAILEVRLHTENYDKKSVMSILKTINQKIILLLRSNTQFRLAIFNDALIEGEWSDIEPKLIIEGLDLDSIWNHIVIDIGNISLEGDHTLCEQIAINKEREKLSAEINRLRLKMASVKQPRVQRSLYAEIKEIETKLKNL